MTSTIGRLVVDVQTNKSGGSVAYGDVVVSDTANDHSFTTTTSSGFNTGVVGVCIEPNGIASNATGRIQFQGYCPQVNAAASVTRGYFLKTHTVAKQATSSSSRAAGAFGVALKTSSTPDAYLWGLPDNAGASGETVATSAIWDTKGDLAAATGADAGAKLAVGTNDQVLIADSSQSTGLKWGWNPKGQVLSVWPPGFVADSSDTTSNTASQAYAIPVSIPGFMKLRSFRIKVTVTGAGTSHQWGLFDITSSLSAATKLAGGSGALGSTGWVDIDATSAPVSIPPGNYMLVFQIATSSAATVAFTAYTSSTGPGVERFQAGYTWDDTPDFTTGWSAHAATIKAVLIGDMDASNTEWAP